MSFVFRILLRCAWQGSLSVYTVWALLASRTCQFLSLPTLGSSRPLLLLGLCEPHPFSCPSRTGRAQCPSPAPPAARLQSLPSALSVLRVPCLQLSAHAVASFLPSSWLGSAPQAFWFCYSTFFIQRFPCGSSLNLILLRPSIFFICLGVCDCSRKQALDGFQALGVT